MNAELACLVVLATHGSAYLNGDDDIAHAIEQSSAGFQYARTTTFRMPTTGMFRRARIADGAAHWLQMLRADGTRRLYLWVPARNAPRDHGLHAVDAAAFANGEPWALVSRGRRDHLWTMHWETASSDAPDQAVWDVEIAGAPVDPPDVRRPDLARSRDELLRALESSRAFAEAHRLPNWVTCFERAARTATHPGPLPPDHLDLVPATAPFEHRRLSAAAAQAWVFGGMGSWNDVWLKDERARQEHDALLQTLYETVLSSFVAVTNS